MRGAGRPPRRQTDRPDRVEAEVTEFLGRARYQRAASTENVRAGSRNGYCPTTVKTTAGPGTIEWPKLRGTTEAFASRLFGAGVTKTNAAWASGSHAPDVPVGSRSHCPRLVPAGVGKIAPDLHSQVRFE